MHDRPALWQTFPPHPFQIETDIGSAIAAIPLADGLKRSVLDVLLDGAPEAAYIVQAAGLGDCASRPLTPHEAATLDAVTGQSMDVGTRALLRAVRQSRGPELLAWADLASLATRLRLGAFA